MTEAIVFILGVVLAGLVARRLSVRWARRYSENERNLLRRTRRAEKLAEMGSLTGHLAHEIRNPLSTLKINLKLLSEDFDRLSKEINNRDDKTASAINDLQQRLQRQRKRIETLNNEADRLERTLNDFLNYAGKMELHPVRHDMNELLEEVIDFYEPQAVAAGVQMRPNLGEGPLWCRIDVDMIKQAILNLLINATQAMNDKGELIVRSNRRGEAVKIDVIDTGPGIPAGQQETIFNAYFTTKSGGSGLGLSTTRRIIEEHDGHLDLHSEPGKGSSFTIFLPLVE